MRFHKVALFGLIACGFVATNQSTAVAFDGCFGGLGYNYGALYNNLDYRVPYFAAHPPVYYSAPVPRSYGHSPFAYPPYFRTPEVVESANAVTIVNPYAKSGATQENSEASSPADENFARDVPELPLIVNNPYVNQTTPVVQVRQ